MTGAALSRSTRCRTATNPPSGRFVSANNKIVPDSYPYFLSRDWDLPDRAERIAALLDAEPLQTPATSAAIEADTLSLMAKRLVPLMTRIAPADPAAREAIELLRHGISAWTATRPHRCCSRPGCAFSHAVLFGRFGDAVADYWDLKPESWRRC